MLLKINDGTAKSEAHFGRLLEEDKIVLLRILQFTTFVGFFKKYLSEHCEIIPLKMNSNLTSMVSGEQFPCQI